MRNKTFWTIIAVLVLTSMAAGFIMTVTGIAVVYTQNEIKKEARYIEVYTFEQAVQKCQLDVPEWSLEDGAFIRSSVKQYEPGFMEIDYYVVPKDGYPETDLFVDLNAIFIKKVLKEEGILFWYKVTYTVDCHWDMYSYK